MRGNKLVTIKQLLYHTVISRSSTNKPSIKLIKWNDRWNTAIRINSYDKTSSFGKFFRRKGRNPLTKMKKLGNFFANYFYKKFASRIVKAYRRSIFLSVHRFKYDMQLSLHTGKSILNAKIFAH